MGLLSKDKTAKTLSECSICGKQLYVIRIDKKDAIVVCSNCDATDWWPSLQGSPQPPEEEGASS